MNHFFFLEEGEQLAALAVLENEVQLPFALKGVVHADQEGVLGELYEDVPLRQDVTLLLLFGDVYFLYHLHGIVLLIVLFFHQNHFRVGPLADHRHCRE